MLKDYKNNCEGGVTRTHLKRTLVAQFIVEKKRKVAKKKVVVKRQRSQFPLLKPPETDPRSGLKTLHMCSIHPADLLICLRRRRAALLPMAR